MNAIEFLEINPGIKPSNISYSAIALYRPRFMATTMACRTNSEKWVFRAWHSDSTMAKSAGLILKPLMSVCLHFDSFNVVFSFASEPAIKKAYPLMYL
jgi:hypothetical protein